VFLAGWDAVLDTALDKPLQRIRVIDGDTDRTPYGFGTFASRSLVISGGAALLAARKVRTAGVVVGSWPREPGLAERENLADLETLASGPLAGLLPEDSGSLPPTEFLAVARDGLAPDLGGRRRPPQTIAR